jgi:hypothetical protein
MTVDLGTLLPIGTAVMGGGLGALLKVVLDHKRRKREQSDDVALSLVDKQNERIEKLETDMATERDTCTARIEKLERQADEDRKTNEALDMLRRHQVSNTKHVVDMTIDLIEVAPDRLPEIIARIRARRDEHDAIEARDKAAFMAARFGGIVPVIEEPAI